MRAACDFGVAYRLIVALAVSALWLPLSGVVAESISLEGGDTTIDDASPAAYAKPLANLSDATSLLHHELGDQGFRRNFARVRVRGLRVLGPKFNHSSCVGCHPGNGRGSPVFGPSSSQAVVKVSAARGRAVLPGGPFVVRGVGTQIRDHATDRARSDGRLRLLWEFTRGFYADGNAFELRRPLLTRSGRAAKLPTDTMFSLRRPPPVFGVGLLDAVDVQSLAALADPEDSDRDGISGRMNVVWSVRDRTTTVGKFGLKASSPSVLQQVAGAYATDMGVTNPLFFGGSRTPEIDSVILGRTVFYAQTLAVPQARDQDSPATIRGHEIFDFIGCGKCHTSSLQTGSYSIPELSKQLIHPFTDLLLHDMGEELADGRPEFQASGSEWRTAPLWGIGLTSVVLGSAEASYLHDGRARTLEEAILWHGGEGLVAKNNFMSLPQDARDSLIQFLRSL